METIDEKPYNEVENAPMPEAGGAQELPESVVPETAPDGGKKRQRKKLFVIAGIALVVLIAAIVAICLAGESYMTPVREMQKMDNAKTVNASKYVKCQIEKLGTDNAEKIMKILCESDEFVDSLEDLKERHTRNYENRQDQYGDAFKISYRVEEKTELGKSALRDYQKEYRELFVNWESAIECMKEEYNAMEWGYLANHLGLTREQTKELIDALDDMLQGIGRPEVTAGYTLLITAVVKGSALDRPKEYTSRMLVLKINGRWTFVSSFEYAANIISDILDD